MPLFSCVLLTQSITIVCNLVLANFRLKIFFKKWSCVFLVRKPENAILIFLFLICCSSGQESFFYQLFVEKDDKVVLPTVQQLFDQSFLTSDIKLKEVCKR